MRPLLLALVLCAWTSVSARDLGAELGSQDPAVARAAAVELGRTRKVEPLLDALALGLAPDVAAAALDALAPLRARAALDVLLGYARHRAPELRARAVVALTALDDKRARAAALAALGDLDPEVRGAAGRALAGRHEKAALPPLLALVKRGDPAAAEPLAALADAGVAREVAELTGRVPDTVLARALGAMLSRSDLGPDALYLSVVRALGAIPGQDSSAALETFTQTGKTRASAKEARAILDARSGK